MGTKRREKGPGRTKPGSPRPGGRVSRSRLEKIPIPPAPAFLQSTTRAPERKQDPGNDPPPGADIADEVRTDPLGLDALSTNAISDEEADLLLGVTPAVGADRSEPVHEEPPGPVTPARSGASGAAVLNELVDEIEKDLERDLDRHAPEPQARRYGRTIGCWVSPLADGPDLHPPETMRKKDEEGTR
jgi:hypothetical protein